MNPSATALVGYALWTIAIVFIIPAVRVPLIMGGKREANSFSSDGTDVSPFAARLARVHANCLENLPVFAALVLAALATGNAAVTDGLAMWVLGARIAQSTVHLSSGSNLAVNFRFAFFLVQAVIEIRWAYQLLTL